MPDSDWICRREYIVVPAAERVEIGSYMLHRAAHMDLHRVVDGWSARLDDDGEPILDGDQPIFDAIIIEATEAE